MPFTLPPRGLGRALFVLLLALPTIAHAAGILAISAVAKVPASLSHPAEVLVSGTCVQGGDKSLHLRWQLRGGRIDQRQHGDALRIGRTAGHRQRDPQTRRGDIRIVRTNKAALSSARKIGF